VEVRFGLESRAQTQASERANRPGPGVVPV